MSLFLVHAEGSKHANANILIEKEDFLKLNGFTFPKVNPGSSFLTIH